MHHIRTNHLSNNKRIVENSMINDLTSLKG